MEPASSAHLRDTVRKFNPLKTLASSAGFEPTTYSLGGCRSILLSYEDGSAGRKQTMHALQFKSMFLGAKQAILSIARAWNAIGATIWMSVKGRMKHLRSRDDGQKSATHIRRCSQSHEPDPFRCRATDAVRSRTRTSPCWIGGLVKLGSHHGNRRKKRVKPAPTAQRTAARSPKATDQAAAAAFLAISRFKRRTSGAISTVFALSR